MYSRGHAPDNGDMRDLVVTSSVVVPEGELAWRFSRSSGPGGQSVNTADSRVELSVDVASTSALSTMLRDRALKRLSDRLVDGVVTVTASEHSFQPGIDGETVSIVPRTTIREIHGYKACATQRT